MAVADQSKPGTSDSCRFLLSSSIPRERGSLPCDRRGSVLFGMSPLYLLPFPLIPSVSHVWAHLPIR